VYNILYKFEEFGTSPKMSLLFGLELDPTKQKIPLVGAKEA
jgi:hypothetical protein